MPALTRLLPALLLALAGPLVVPAGPAQAASRVTVANPDGDSVVDPTYATTLTVRGSGFQSVRGGHGGIYVFFGAVDGSWRPSQGGASGVDYWYVPDSQERENQGFQKFVSFPGSDTAGSANGGTISASGAWSTSLVVPGATFRAYDQDDGVRTVDCRKLTCGIITVGAHGVDNARNETFTPVRVASLQDGGPPPSGAATPATPADPAASATPEAGATAPAAAPGSPDVPAATTPGGGAATGASAPAALEVDRASAAVGNVLAFTATGLPPSRQVTVVLDDGAAGAGPFLVGADGGVAGVLTLPEDTVTGTHELRVHGVADPPSVRFAVTGADVAPAAAAQSEQDRAGLLFAGVSALVLLAALARLASRHGVRQRVAHWVTQRGVRRAA
ncbi:hypothetical protein [Nocardioides dongkuii]|uniref:hypothetical protein n=1 Tax=Nocardioides dongkuii TaxID=2760089 RepID=UPI0015FB6A06|nr:hypothetical protein [Nocardioides dongkuii]